MEEISKCVELGVKINIDNHNNRSGVGQPDRAVLADWEVVTMARGAVGIAGIDRFAACDALPERPIAATHRP